MGIFRKGASPATSALRLFNGEYIASFVERNPNDYNKNFTETKDLTVLSMDINYFSPNSPEFTNEYMINFLNIYHEHMAAAIYANSGEIIHLQGDALFACFGLKKADTAAIDACNASLACVQACNKVELEGKGSLSISIGLHSGETYVGVYGSKYRRQFSVIGKVMNLSSRLEGTNKNYGTYIMISEETQKQTKSVFRTRELDEIRVKGSDTPMKIFELLA
jgi:adenylate cyclase